MAESHAVSILFGSQTGCAESIAQRIYDEALERQLDAVLMPLNDFQASKITDIANHHVIIVCSTTGNGEPPDNAGKFWRHIKRRTQPKDLLANLFYTVLGLGDTNYDKFCYMGKSIDKRFSELGAQRFYSMGAADEALGLEDSVEPWLLELWTAFDKSRGVGEASTCSSSSDDAASDEATLQSTPEEDTKKVYLQESIATYVKMFGPLETATEIPEDIPRLQASLFSLRFLDNTENLHTDATTVPKRKMSETGEYSSSNPFLASITRAKYLTASHSERKVLGLEINLQGSGIRYNPGDAIGIKCPNRVEDVDALLTRLNIDGEKLFFVEPVASTGRRSTVKTASSDRFPSPCTVHDALLYHADILSSPKKAALRALATYCTDEEERARMLVLSSKSGADKYNMFVADQQLNFVELLYLFPSCNPPLDHLLSLLPQLMPRYYSIASSPLAHPEQLTLALTIVDNNVGSNGIHRRGLCSHWLNQICQPLLGKAPTESEVKIPVFLRSTRDFLLPASHRWPLLLIGPGTGVAPFIGFLQHRYHEVKNHLDQASNVCSGVWRGGMELDLEEDKEFTSSPAIGGSKGIYLFFGCRRKDEDWIFRDEMQEFVANGTLKELITAFSREQEEKHYVQHEIRLRGKLVCDLLLESGGYVYVCGDGVQMARDVHDALCDVLQEHANLSKEAAEDQLKSLAVRQRYVRDIWC